MQTIGVCGLWLENSKRLVLGGSHVPPRQFHGLDLFVFSLTEARDTYLHLWHLMHIDLTLIHTKQGVIGSPMTSSCLGSDTVHWPVCIEDVGVT